MIGWGPTRARHFYFVCTQHNFVDHSISNLFLRIRNLPALQVWRQAEQTNKCCCTKVRWISACIAELTYGSVWEWCITKADIWLSQIGPDTQSRQLGDSLQRKITSWDFFFVIYFLFEGDMRVGIANNFFTCLTQKSNFVLNYLLLDRLNTILTYQVLVSHMTDFKLMVAQQSGKGLNIKVVKWW